MKMMSLAILLTAQHGKLDAMEGFPTGEGDANGDGQKESPGKDARACGNEEGFTNAY